MSTLKFKHDPIKSFNNLMNDFLIDFPSLYGDSNSLYSGQSVPVNIRENEDGYKLDIIAPGFSRDEFKIQLEKNLLNVSIEKKAQEENKNEKQIRKEYEFQTFKRTFTIDEKIDVENIEAKYENGVLTLGLAKKTEVKPVAKQITIL